MATAYTSLLGLALPVQGELQGTWGDTVNNSITSLLDTAVAGTTTLNTDADVTLSTTTGAANQARQAIILWTANGTVTRNITAPAQSKIYTVINKTAGSQSIVIRGVGPTTGVTIPAGFSATVAWDGADFVDVSKYIGGNLTVNGNLAVNGNTTLGNAAADTLTVTATVTSNVIFTDNTYDIGASGATRPRTGYFGTSVISPLLTATNLQVTNIKANDGTAAASIANSTGIISISSNPILSGGTANGVLYLNGSKSATSGSAITFDGTNFATTGTVSGTKLIPTGGAVTGNGMYLPAANAVAITTNGANAIYIDSSQNVGIGVTPSVNSVSGSGYRQIEIGTTAGNMVFAGGNEMYVIQNAYWNSGLKYAQNAAATYYRQNGGQHQWYNAPSGTAGNAITFTQAMTLDASGNLLVGTTSSTYNSAGRGVIELNGTSDNIFAMKVAGAQNFYLQSNATNTAVWNVANTYMSFGTNNTERMRIDSSGKVGIGVTPSYRFDVAGPATAGLTTIQQIRTGSGNTYGLQIQGNYTTEDWFINAYYSGYLAFGTNNTERMRIDSSGNVGIGTTSPTDKLHVAGTTKTTGNTTLVYDGTAAYLNVGDASPPAGVNTLQHIFSGYGVFAGQKVNNGELDIGYNFYYQSGFKSRVDGIAYRLSMGEVSGQIDLQIAPAPGGAGSALTFTKVLLAQKDKSIALQGTIPQTGTGITFPATQSASSDANTLDDYEEGTFTPTVQGSTSAGTGTYTYQTGRYVKVGSLVTVEVHLNWTAHTGTGDLQFAGLPFAALNATQVYASATIGVAGNLALTANNILTGYVAPNTSFVVAHQYPVGGGAQTNVPMDTSAIIVFSMTYITAT